MYLLQNALQNLRRNKVRNTMIGAIIFAVILTTVVALTINNTSDQVIENYKDKFGSEVSISPNMQKVRDEAMANSTSGRVQMRMPTMPTELLLQLTDSEYLKESLATGTISGASDEIIAVDQSDSSDDSSSNSGAETGGPMGNAGGAIGGGGASLQIAGTSGNYQLQGDNWQDFTDGSRTLSDDGISVMPQTINECLISQELAENNELVVGDSVTFTANLSVELPSSLDTSSYASGDEVTLGGQTYTLSAGMEEAFRASREVSYTLKIVGLYDDLNDEYPNANLTNMPSMNSRNVVFTTLETLLAPRATDETGINVSVTYYLKNPDLLSQFEAEARAKGVSDLFAITTDTASYETIVKPVEGMKNISLTFMAVVVVLGMIILLLLVSISVRERKYEIGVLRAMGLKRASVALGLWYELLAITGLCLVLGLGIGLVVAQPVCDVLLQSQIEAVEGSAAATNAGASAMPGAPGGRAGGSAPTGAMTTQNGGAGGFSGPGGMVISGNAPSNAQPLSEMQISIEPFTILEIVLIALVLASLAGVVSVTRITRYEPIKILMERN